MRFDGHSDRSWCRAASGNRGETHGGSGARRPTPARRRELTAERSAEIRQRVLAGAYNGRGMAGEVARRILASGDLPR